MEPTISLKGMYDLHVHASPSIIRRKLTSFEVLKLASSEGMAGVLLLDHTHNTTMVAAVMNEMGYGTKIFGSILLNESVGGLNPFVVESAIQLGTKQIQMPTYSSRSHKEKYGDDQNFPYQTKSKDIRILNDKGKLIPEVEEILEILKNSNSFLGTGHLSAEETVALVNRAKELKIRVMVNSVSTDIVDMPIETQRQLASENVFMGHDYAVLTDMVHRKTPIESLVQQIRSVGAGRCVLATDSGQMMVPDLATGLKDFIRQLTVKGISENELDLMLRKNPQIVLGLV